MRKISPIRFMRGALFFLLLISACTPAVPPGTATPTNTTQPPSATVTVPVPPSETMTAQPDRAIGTLFVNPDNPRYFTDGTMQNGKYRAVYLTGAHTWCNFTDCGNTNPPPVFNYQEYLDFLEANNLNFFRLWRAENARGGETGDDFWFYPLPYQRSATECCAFDGGNKFDLEKFDQAYFDRLRERVKEAGDRGIYVSIMLFDGWSIESKSPETHQPWKGHPFNINNNVNDVNGDLDGNGQGGETHTLANAQVTVLQESYIRKVVDTVNDLDNVLYEISNESSSDSKDWQYHMINFIKEYEKTKPKQHPVGMTVTWPNGSNADLYSSPADWVSLNGDPGNPPVADGTKVIIADTDHLCGICGNPEWIWKSFTHGENPIFMDPYDEVQSGRGAPLGYDRNNTKDSELRSNLGYSRYFANRMNLAATTPRPDLCSTGYCLANPVKKEAEYLVFLPAGDMMAKIFNKLGVENAPAMDLPGEGVVQVDLSASPVELSVEWFNIQEGKKITADPVQGGSVQSFTAPFSGDAVLYLYDSSQ